MDLQRWSIIIDMSKSCVVGMWRHLQYHDGKSALAARQKGRQALLKKDFTALLKWLQINHCIKSRLFLSCAGIRQLHL